MTMNKVQPFLDEAFEFLRDREFSVSREDWAKFCDNQGMSLEKLKSAKSELLRQSQKVDDDSDRLKQIFCCDPFDASNTKALRDIWHNKAEYQPDPFQRWFSDISIHLLDLGSVSSPNPISPAPSPTIASYTKPISTTPNPASVTPKLSKELLSAVITGSIIGVFVMGAMIINNAGKQSPIAVSPSPISEPKSSPSQQTIPTPVQTVQTPPPQQTAPTPVQTPPSQQTAPTPVQTSFTRSSPLISRQEAVDLIRKWLNAKEQIFAPPYNRNLASEILTGRAYECNLGSIDWLENNGAYYSYGVRRIDEVTQFAESGNNATIEVKFTEQRTLHNANGGIDRKASKFGQSKMLYNLRRDNGQWKISYFRLPNC